MLLDRLKKGPMKESHAAAAFYQILSCILFMHHEGYLHRDLKPDNVMLAKTWCPEANGDEPPPVRLIDLGMVLKFVDEPNETGLMGSPGYMSPEAIRYKPICCSRASPELRQTVELHQCLQVCRTMVNCSTGHTTQCSLAGKQTALLCASQSVLNFCVLRLHLATYDALQK